MDKESIRKIILNTEKPVVLTEIDIPWYFFKESFKDWLSRMHTAHPDVQFQLSNQKHSNTIQMEHEREISPEVNFGSFLEYSQSPKQESRWATFSYKYLKDYPTVGDYGAINMGFCGFPEIHDDISFWLGSRGAHTPCHYDTYGRNVVVQVYGTKRWILFPKEDLEDTQTRVPYEESSVYSRLPFFSPKDPNAYNHLSSRAYIVDLKPGEILIVPPHWWHYVESIDASLAINAWILTATDTVFQIDEYLVKYQVSKFLPEEIFNECVFSVEGQRDLRDFQADSEEFKLNLLMFLKDQVKHGKKFKSKDLLNYNDLQTILSNHHVRVVDKCDPERFMDIIRSNSSLRFCPELEKRRLENSSNRLLKEYISILINTVTSRDVLSKLQSNLC